jgi:hypothetical protein
LAETPALADGEGLGLGVANGLVVRSHAVIVRLMPRTRKRRTKV